MNLHTRTDAAKFLNINPRTLDSWMREGKLPYTRVGHYRLLDLETVQAVAKERAEKRAKRKSRTA